MQGRKTLLSKRGYFLMSNEYLHSDRLARAFDYAAICHAAQRRKGTQIPYLSPLIGVASLLMEARDGSRTTDELEDLVIACLLHDVVEDQGGPERLEDVRVRFGERVAKIVDDCSDAAPEQGKGKPPWVTRKRAYFDHLRSTNDLGTLLVSAADKTHNARAILTDLRVFEDQKKSPKDFWMRFVRDKDDAAYPDRINEILWYYDELARIFEAKASKHESESLKRLYLELSAAVRDIMEMSKSEGLKPVEPSADLKVAS